MRDEPSRRVDQCEPGYFEMRLVKGGPLVAAEIIGDEKGRWRCTIDGKRQDDFSPEPSQAVWRIWHGARRVDRVIFEYRLALATWAKAEQPGHPAAQPDEPIDVLTAPLPF